MVQGMACFIAFDNDEVEGRFLSWVEKGNAKSKSMGVSSLSLRARILKVDDRKYLFLWDHFFMFSIAWFMRFMFWMQLRKVRKQYSITRVRRLDFIELVIERGLKRGK